MQELLGGGPAMTSTATTTTGAARPPAKSGRMPLSQILALGFPALPHAFIALPLGIVIPAFYASHTQVTLTQIGVLTAASRVIDAFFDPTIGYLSDRLDTPLGKRKPWLLAASVVCSISLFFLFQPPASATIVYYGLWSFLLYFGFSLFEIPRSAWSAEVNRDYGERSRINTSIAQFNVIGSLVFWVTPIVLAGVTGTTSLTGASLTAIAWLYAVLMPAGLIVAVWIVPRGVPVVAKTLRLIDIGKSILRNKPLRAYMLAYTFWGLGQGAALATTILFLSDRMQLADLFPFMMIAFFGATVAAIPIWMRMVPRFGRHRVWAISLIGSALARPIVLLLPIGHAAAIPLLVLTCLNAFMGAPWNFCPPSVLSDVIDHDTWESGTNKAGAFFALNSLSVKVTTAIGSGGAFILLDAFHYHVGKLNTGQADLGLIIAYMVIPGVLHCLAAYYAWRFPLDEKSQTEVRRQLEVRAAQIPELAAGLPAGQAAPVEAM
ncbi:MAG TPA: MFS transporter [Caulobacteraceae bacterium]|jgi:Na+/melibiose symporter-like transporter|nr:MFS transporter [Caulobacteraceae bacterium]